MFRNLDPAHLDRWGRKREGLESAAWRACGAHLGVGGTGCGSEPTDMVPGAEEPYLSGKERAGGQGGWHQRGLLPAEVGKGVYWKMLKVSICASDFSSQSKNWGESFEGPSLPIAVMSFDGREKKSNMFQNQGWAFEC